jgi:hypothetical protein
VTNLAAASMPPEHLGQALSGKRTEKSRNFAIGVILP